MNIPIGTRSEAQDRTSVAITIYNDDLALIRESRQLPLQNGLNRIALCDVSARIKPETASLGTRGGATLHLLEQNFDYDLLNAQSLLNQYIGKRVTICRINPATGAEHREEATVLANNGGAILQYAGWCPKMYAASNKSVVDIEKSDGKCLNVIEHLLGKTAGFTHRTAYPLA